MKKKILGLLIILMTLTQSLYANLYQGGINEYKNSNEKKSLSLFKESCKTEGSYFCYEIGKKIFLGETLNKDYKNAKYFLKKACEKDFLKACNMMGYIYGNGLTGKKDIY